ncbi:MAG: LPS-assembly protein LptD [Chitinophagaceae bacterium]|nr:LPS-assembly protein LptD [Chitinophagaceae bacterium]
MLSLLVLLGTTVYGNGINSSFNNFHITLTTDTIPIVNNPDSNSNLAPLSKVANTRDTIPVTDTFSFKKSASGLDAPVTYHADDSMILDVPTKKIILYGKETKVKYTDNELIAPHIEFDQRTNLVSAYLTKDSLGEVISYPTFLQADFKTVSDSIRFNMKTGKGLTKGTYTRQGEMYVYGEKIKKADSAVFYALNGRFTTCNLDTPHFAFVSKKIKFINKKMAFTGPVHPEVEGVPLPVVFPFGIYPLQQGRHSGFLAPTFTANDQLGLALEGLGYYKILSDNWDIVARGTLYSYGGWTFNASPRYVKRYRYQGSLGLDVQHFKDIDKAGQRSLM